MDSEEQKKQKPCPTVKQLVLAGIITVVLPYALIFLMGALGEKYFLIYEYTAVVLGAAGLLLVVLAVRFFMMLFRYRRENKPEKLAAEK